MNQTLLSDNFNYALVSFLLQAKQNVLSVAAEFDLSMGQAFSLLLMESSSSRSMKSYCKAYNCDAGNLTGLIDGLEEKGLVVREQDPNDRRIKVIRMLPAGARLQKKLLARLAEVHNDLFRSLGEDEQAHFAHAIEKIHGSQQFA
jgi:DNA-binding MarR family transcriptional regulator